MLANQKAFKLHPVVVLISDLRMDRHELLPKVEAWVENLGDLLQAQKNHLQRIKRVSVNVREKLRNHRGLQKLEIVDGQEIQVLFVDEKDALLLLLARGSFRI